MEREFHGRRNVQACPSCGTKILAIDKATLSAGDLAAIERPGEWRQDDKPIVFATDGEVFECPTPGCLHTFEFVTTSPDDERLCHG